MPEENRPASVHVTQKLSRTSASRSSTRNAFRNRLVLVTSRRWLYFLPTVKSRNITEGGLAAI